MAIELEGEFTVPRDREAVFGYLTDLGQVSGRLPDLQSVEVKDPRNATLKLRVGISFIRGTATVRLTLAEANRPESAKFMAQGSMTGNSFDVEAGFHLQSGDGETRVKWRGLARVGGTLASVAGGLLEPLAKKNIVRFVEGIRAGIANPGA
ncbi:MAG: CoxG family protein [Nitrospinota bacterium]